MWLYFPVAVARNVFGAPDQNSPLYQQGVEWAGVCFGATPRCASRSRSSCRRSRGRSAGRARTRSACWPAPPACLSVTTIHEPKMLLLSMAGVGIAWASILSMPYAILAGSLPREKTGRLHGDLQLLHCDPGDRRVVRLRLGDVARVGQQPAVAPWWPAACSCSWRRFSCGACAIRARRRPRPRPASRS